ncbi:MAG: nitroreductase family protein [Escherichia coli]
MQGHCAGPHLRCLSVGTQNVFKPAPEFWSIDAAIAAQNMILAAHDLGVGSVWLGTYPIESYVRAQAELFHLPRTIVPHSIIAFGYPEDAVLQERNLYEADRVHFECW